MNNEGTKEQRKLTRVGRLRKELPSGFDCRGDGKRIIVTAMDGQRPVEFRVDKNAGWEEKELAAYLGSKMPAATI